MSVRLAIPVEDSKGLDARLTEHFGRAPYFAVVELDEEGKVVSLDVVPNKSEHFGGRGKPPEILMRLRPDAVVTYGMGFRALNMFQAANIAVLQTNHNLVREIVEAYNNDELVELTEGCRHAKHR